MTKQRSSILLLTFLFVFASAASGKGLTLRFAPELGTEYRFGVEQEQGIVMSLGPMGKQNMTSSSRFEMRWMALDRSPKGNTRMRMNVDRIVMRVEQGDSLVMQLDTDAMGQADGERAESLADTMGLVLATELTVTVSPRGEIVGITGFESVWDGMREKLANDSQAQQILGMVEQGFSSESLAQQMRQSFPVFPEGGVIEGDSWVQASEIENPIVGSIGMTSTYTVGEDKVTDGQSCRELLIETEIEMEGSGDMVEQMMQMTGAEMDVAFDGTETSGTMCIDYTTGLPLVSRMNVGMTMRMSMDLGAEAEVSEDAELPSKLDMEVVLDGTVAMQQLSAKKVESK